MRTAKVCLGVLLCIVSLSLASFGDNLSRQQKFWTDYILTCSPDAQFNGKSVFLGSTNPIGPGSVWGLGGGSANFVAPSETYLGSADPKGKIPGVQYPPSPNSCSAVGARSWDLSLGLPINLTGGGASADLSLALKNAKSITIEIEGAQVDSVAIATWQDSANKIDHSSAAYTDAVDGKHYLMSAAVAVTGLKITFNLDSSISAALKANFQAGKTVTVGSPDNPMQAQVNVDTTGQKVIFEAKERAYVLGQLLLIDKIPPKKQGYAKVMGPTGQQIVRPMSPIIVKSRGAN
jgi:hypothetical protein